MNIQKITTFTIGICIGIILNSTSMDLKNSDEKNTLIIDQTENKEDDNQQEILNLSHIVERDTCCKKTFWGFGFCTGKSVSCWKSINRRPEDISEHCGLLAWSTMLSVTFTFELVGISGLCQGISPSIVPISFIICGAIPTVYTGCVLGTYFCCDQCCYYQYCPKGFRSGFLCQPQHTCGPAGCTAIRNCCVETGNCFINVFQCIWSKGIKRCLQPVLTAWDQAFDPQRFQRNTHSQK